MTKGIDYGRSPMSVTRARSPMDIRSIRPDALRDPPQVKSWEKKAKLAEKASMDADQPSQLSADGMVAGRLEEGSAELKTTDPPEEPGQIGTVERSTRRPRLKKNPPQKDKKNKSRQ